MGTSEAVPATGRNVEALRQLRRVIEAAPEDRLHMNTWSEVAKCGTAYCAGGWAAIDPWFRANTLIGEVFQVVEGDGGGDPRVFARVPDVFDDLDDLIFRIGRRNTEVLFAAYGGIVAEHDITKAEVLGRIDALIDGKDIEPYDAVIAAMEEDDDDSDDDDYWGLEDDDDSDDDDY